MWEHQWKVEDNGLQPGVSGLHLGLLKKIVGNNSEDLWVTSKWWLATVPFNKLTHFLKEQIFLLWGEMSTYCNTGYLKGKFICPYMHVYIFNDIYNYTYTHSYWHIYLYVNNQKLNNESLLLISAIFFFMSDILQTWALWRFPAITLCSKCLTLEFHIFLSDSESPCLEYIWYFAEAWIWITL